MDDANEDSWLYGTSNPDSTTDEAQGDEKNQNEVDSALKSENGLPFHPLALADIQNASDEMMTSTKEEQEDVAEFEDPAHEMEEDEAATAVADTTVADTEIGVTEEDDEEQQQHQSKSLAGSDDDDDEDESDDDINVVIGDIKAAPSSYNIKQRGNLLAAQAGGEKAKGAAQGGKFTIEDFDGVGSINGVAAHEFSIDSLEDKPWRKPGADITDYFNYGFNEETWRAYCERQKRFRVVESGVGLTSLTQNLNQSMDRHGEHGQSGLLPPPLGGMPGMPDNMQGPSQGMMPPPMSSHHHNVLQRIPLGPRPPRPMNISGSSSGGQSKENAIQVMTAECREYSRPGQMSTNFGVPPPGDEPFFAEPDPFDYGYEPTQESQWGNNDNPGWVPTGIKELTPGPALVQPPQMTGPPGVPPSQPMSGPPQMRGPPPQMMGPMAPNMPMGPPPPHVMGPMMMGPGGGPMRMPMMGMMPPQQHGGPPLLQPKIEPLDEKPRSPSRRNRSRSPIRARRRSKSPVRDRQRRSRSKSHKPRTRRSRSSSKARKTTTRTSRRSRSRSGSKSRKVTRTHRSRSRSESKSRTKRSRRTHSRTRSKSPKAASTSTSSSKKRSEKTEK